MSKRVRSVAHGAVVSVLVARRVKMGLSQREVADRLPAWLELTHIMLAKVETRRRHLSFVEVREIAKVLGTSIARVDKAASALEAARETALMRAPPKRRRSGR